MKGFYFINTDLRTTRAHTSQVLHTTTALQAFLPLSLVAPQFPALNLEMIAKRHDLPRVPGAALLWNFNIRRPGILAFILFNIPAILFLLVKKIKGEAGFIYVRATYFLPLIFIAFVFRVPCFYETHRRPVSFSERLRDDIIARMAAGHVIISERVREYYTRYKKPTLVIHDAVALKRFAVRIGKAQARKQLGFASDARICVYTGTVSSLKGIDYLVEAACLLSDVSFVLVGRIATEFQGVPLPANVTLMGEKEQGELPAILQAADALLLPHPDNDYSQSPMKLFEYMASDVPIVASRLSSISEVLNDTNSFLVEAGRAETLAEGIATALGDRARATRLAAQAQRDVADYTWEMRGQKIAAFIRDTLNHDF
ncbi:glycosyltransferase [Candidatus Kaiserbacteria bacterium]|nr:glycosyltransferase [Candidatus Kaiserbacteria bacterium]